MKWWLVSGLVTVIVVAAPAPARADPARPTNYRSTVTGIEPATTAVRASVRGGDAFLYLEQLAPVEVIVSGYQGEPYLRFDSDGEVWANTNSPAFYINDDRYAQVTVPPEAGPDAEPEWVRVASGGSFGWHDHRIHWMAPEPPPGVDQGAVSPIQEWEVPIVVDGVELEIRGTLIWEPSVSPFPWLIVTAVAGLVMVWAARRGWVVPALVSGGVCSVLVGLAQAAESPFGLAGELLAWAPGAVVLILAALVLWRGPKITTVGVAAVVLGVWVAPRLTTFVMPVLPTALPVAVERLSVSVVAASVLALAYWLLMELRADQPRALLL